MEISTDDYRKLIEEMAARKDATPFNNDGTMHSTIVLANIFFHSTQIKIYDRDLQGGISTDEIYLANLNMFLAKKGKLELALKTIPSYSEAFKNILTYAELHPENIRIRIAPEELPYNMVVGENCMYRLEYDPENYRALCCFNDEEGTSELVKQFDTLFKKSTVFI